MLHLVRRFFGFLTAVPLSPSEQIEITLALDPQLQRLFYRQRHEDQRHAYEVARRVSARPDRIEAALLHDVGKTKVTLGPIGRAFATLWSLTSLPIWGQWRLYLDHGQIGADLLEANGAGVFAVAFARNHPGPPPDGIERKSWTELERADHA